MYACRLNALGSLDLIHSVILMATAVFPLKSLKWLERVTRTYIRDVLAGATSMSSITTCDLPPLLK